MHLDYKKIYLWFEAHVKHPVCFVEDEVGDGLDFDAAGLHQVVEPARSGDDNLDTLRHHLHLFLSVTSAIDADGFDTSVEIF